MEALPSSGIPPPQPPLECATFILYFASDQDRGILKLRGTDMLGVGLDWGWSRPGSIMSSDGNASPPTLPLPKLVCPDLLVVLVEYATLAHLQDPGED